MSTAKKEIVPIELTLRKRTLLMWQKMLYLRVLKRRSLADIALAMKVLFKAFEDLTMSIPVFRRALRKDARCNG